MTTLDQLLIGITMCTSLSICVIFMFRNHLRDVLNDSCCTPRRADFWVMFTQLMLVIAPLLLVIYFTDMRPTLASEPAAFIKDTLFRSLLGIFIAIAMVGRVIWKGAVQDQAARLASLPDKTATEVD